MVVRSIAAVLLACAACHHGREQPRLVIEVRAQLPGTDPDAMVASVTTPLERALASVPHIAALTSETTEGWTRVRVVFAGGNALAVQHDIHAAISRAMPMLPQTLPAPPVYSVVGAPAGRFLVPREAVESAARRVEHLPGVGVVETCGGRLREMAIDLDRPRLAAFDLTVTEVVGALRSGTSGDLGAIVVATKNGLPIHLRDIAVVADRFKPKTCDLLVPSGNLAELVVDAQDASLIDTVRASVHEVVPDAIAEPRGRVPHVQIAPDVDLDDAVIAVHEVLSRLPGTYVAEVRPGDVHILEGGERAVAALRQLPFTRGGGVSTSVVHITGADPHAVATAARTIADRLERAGTLVATHGLAITKTLRTDVDRDRIAALGVTASDIATTLAATGGIDVTYTTSDTDTQRVVVRIFPDGEPLNVRGTGEALVPLGSVTTADERTGPAEILHRNQFPAIDLEVHGTPAIGAVPAGVRVDVDPYP